MKDISITETPSKDFVVLPQENSLLRDFTSRSVNVVGDVNKDGFEDLLIGDPTLSECYVYYGNSNNDFTNLPIGLAIQSLGDSFGWSASGLGDINGDGYDDMVISAMTSNMIYVIYGRSIFPNPLLISSFTSTDGFRIIGSNTTNTLGISVSNAGDFNGDERTDIIVSAAVSSTQNIIYILFLPATGLLQDIYIDLLPKGSYLKIVAPKLSFAGLSLAGLGDINGDGYDDVAIGSIPFQGKFTTQKTYIIYGRGLIQQANFYLSEMISGVDGFVITGGGFVVAAPGDVNNDGKADIMVTSYYDWRAQGNAYLITFPKNISSSPTFYPSSAPSTLPSSIPSAVPSSSMPSSSPSQNNSAGSRPTLPPRTRYPTRIPTVRPTTDAPILVPTEPPTYSPSAEPSIIPTPLPSTEPTPFTTLSQMPVTGKPTSVRSIRTRKPSLQSTKMPNEISFPTSQPSKMIEEYPVLSIDSSGIYSMPDGPTSVYVQGQGNILITGNSGKKVYTIIPVDNSITITDFHENDVLDLMHYPMISNSFNIPFSTNPLILILSSNQQVILSSHKNYALKESNFLFSSSSDNIGMNQKKKKMVDSSLVISLIMLFAFSILFIIFICFPSETLLDRYEKFFLQKDSEEDNIVEEEEEEEEEVWRPDRKNRLDKIEELEDDTDEDEDEEEKDEDEEASASNSFHLSHRLSGGSSGSWRFQHHIEDGWVRSLRSRERRGRLSDFSYTDMSIPELSDEDESDTENDYNKTKEIGADSQFFNNWEELPPLEGTLFDYDRMDVYFPSPFDLNEEEEAQENWQFNNFPIGFPTLPLYPLGSDDIESQGYHLTDFPLVLSHRSDSAEDSAPLDGFPFPPPFFATREHDDDDDDDDNPNDPEVNDQWGGDYYPSDYIFPSFPFLDNYQDEDDPPPVEDYYGEDDPTETD
jgi:hypothetical protein